jgi:hypothetical protein
MSRLAEQAWCMVHRIEVRELMAEVFCDTLVPMPFPDYGPSYSKSFEFLSMIELRLGEGDARFVLF